MAAGERTVQLTRAENPPPPPPKQMCVCLSERKATSMINFENLKKNGQFPEIFCKSLHYFYNLNIQNARCNILIEYHYTVLMHCTYIHGTNFHGTHNVTPATSAHGEISDCLFFTVKFEIIPFFYFWCKSWLFFFFSTVHTGS